jgi:hypothetical protein
MTQAQIMQKRVEMIERLEVAKRTMLDEFLIFM